MKEIENTEAADPKFDVLVGKTARRPTRSSTPVPV